MGLKNNTFPTGMITIPLLDTEISRCNKHSETSRLSAKLKINLHFWYDCPLIISPTPLSAAHRDKFLLPPQSGDLHCAALPTQPFQQKHSLLSAHAHCGPTYFYGKASICWMPPRVQLTHRYEWGHDTHAHFAKVRTAFAGKPVWFSHIVNATESRRKVSGGQNSRSWGNRLKDNCTIGKLVL